MNVMKSMIDANVLISSNLVSSSFLLQMIEILSDQHTIILPSYAVDELI
jgi:predicted nucleic acid-binding protein